jgi:hypothetical protein
VSSIEDTTALFVTTTNALNVAANDFYYKDHDRDFIPPCISDFMLTNLLWLKTPNQAPKLPMKRIIADSYAAIEPDNILMTKWINEINKLKQNTSITEEDYFFMRCSKEVQYVLMEYTLGNPNIITTGAVLGLVEKAKDKIREDMKEIVVTETEKRLQSEASYSKYISEEERKELERINNLKENSRVLTRPLTIIIKVLVLGILICLLLVSLPYNTLLSSSFLGIIPQWPKFIRAAIFLLLLLLVVYQTFWGTSLNSLLNRLDIYVQNRLFIFLDSLSKKQFEKKNSK